MAAKIFFNIFSFSFFFFFFFPLLCVVRFVDIIFHLFSVFYFFLFPIVTDLWIYFFSFSFLVASLYRNVFSGKSDEDEKVEESVVEMAT